MTVAFRQYPGNVYINGQDTKGILLLYEPDESVRDALTLLLEGEDWRICKIESCQALLAQLGSKDVVAVLSEASLPDCTPQDVLETCRKVGKPVIFTGHDISLQGAVDLIRQGAVDFLDKPFPQSRLLDLLARLKS